MVDPRRPHLCRPQRLAFRPGRAGQAALFVHPAMDPSYDGKPSMISETTWTAPIAIAPRPRCTSRPTAPLQDSDAIVHFAFDGADLVGEAALLHAAVDADVPGHDGPVPRRGACSIARASWPPATRCRADPQAGRPARPEGDAAAAGRRAGRAASEGRAARGRSCGRATRSTRSSTTSAGPTSISPTGRSPKLRTCRIHRPRPGRS